MTWPAKVPYFTSENISKGILYGGKECFCTWHWLCTLFGADTPQYHQAIQELHDILTHPDNEDPTWREDHEEKGATIATINSWNDHKRNSTKYIASSLNQLMYNLGYTEYFYL